MPITVTSLHYYPVKSLGGHTVAARRIVRTGFLHDREYMLVDTDGNFLTQREFPRLALVTPVLNGDKMTLSAPSMGPIDLITSAEGERYAVTIWRDVVEAIDMGDLAANWFSAFLQRDVRLVRKVPDSIRQCDQRYVRDEADETAFADGYPFLLTAEESLQALNDRLDFPILMNRFRPNIVISGAGAFTEDNWSQIRIGNILFDVVKPCARCKITTIDQATGVAGQEPLKALALFRNFGGKVLFGQNIVHRGEGLIHIGDNVAVIN